MSFRQSEKIDPPSWKQTLYILLFIQIVTTIGFSSIFPFLPLYVGSLRSVSPLSTEVLAGLVFSAQAFTMTIASPFWGVLADRWGRKSMVVRATLGGAVVVLMMAFVRTAEELVFLRFIQGMITGVIGSINALVAGIVPRERMGYAMGLMQVGAGVGVGLGPLIGGVVADAFGYDAAFFITSALLLVAGVVVIFGVDEGFVKKPDQAGQSRSLLWSWRRIITSSGVSLTYTLRFLNQVGRMAYFPILPLFVLALLHNPERVNSFYRIDHRVVFGHHGRLRCGIGQFGRSYRPSSHSGFLFIDRLLLIYSSRTDRQCRSIADFSMRQRYRHGGYRDVHQCFAGPDLHPSGKKVLFTGWIMLLHPAPASLAL